MFFKKNNNYELLFKCYTIQIDFLLENDNIGQAQTILNEIEESNEFKNDPVFNSNCFIEADQSIKILFMLLQLEVLLKQNKTKSLMMKTIALKQRLGDV